MSKPPDWATGPHTDILDGVEIRPNEDGTIDEIVTHKPIAMLHLEQMNDGQYWIGLTFAGKKCETQHIMLSRKGKFIYPTVYT